MWIWSKRVIERGTCFFVALLNTNRSKKDLHNIIAHEVDREQLLIERITLMGTAPVTFTTGSLQTFIYVRNQNSK